MFNSFLIIALFALSSAAQAMEIVGFRSPSTVIVRDNGLTKVVRLLGTDVSYCGDGPFQTWAARVIGKQAKFDESRQLTLVDSSQHLNAVLSAAGWLMRSDFDESEQDAMAERRGGWECSPQASMFDAMHETVDPRVLASIAMNESLYRGHPWPWTLNVAGRGFYFRSREDAYEAITFLLDRKQCMFDVGLMQVNWCYNGRRFKSAWAALEPKENIRVAEQILNENLRRTGSPSTAVAWYHSANEAKGLPYLEQFIANLKKIEAGS